MFYDQIRYGQKSRSTRDDSPSSSVCFLQRAAKLALQALYLLWGISVCLSVSPSHSGIVSTQGMQKDAVFTVA